MKEKKEKTLMAQEY